MIYLPRPGSECFSEISKDKCHEMMVRYFENVAEFLKNSSDPEVRFETPAKRYEIPVRPGPVLPAREIPARQGLGKVKGRVQLLTAIANIELQAMELIARHFGEFESLPTETAREMVEVGLEEAIHFQLLRKRLEELGSFFNEEPVHLGLWIAASLTEIPEERIAIVHIHLEGGGIDSSAALLKSLVGAGDAETLKIITRIYQDEIKHVGSGLRWVEKISVGKDAFGIQKNVWEKFGERLKEFYLPVDEPGRTRAGFSREFIAAIRQRRRDFGYLNP